MLSKSREAENVVRSLFKSPKPNPLKKTILALALIAGLTAFAANAKAQTFSILSIPATSTHGSYLCLSWNPTSGFSTEYNGANQLYLNSPFTLRGQSPGQVASFQNNSNPNAITVGEVTAGSILDMNTLFSYSSFRVAVNEANRYFGINYSDGSGNTNYGWVEFSTTTNTLTVQAAAMNTTVGQAITVGQLSPLPEPSTYALFGIGAIGMLMVMRRKKTA